MFKDYSRLIVATIVISFLSIPMLGQQKVLKPVVKKNIYFGISKPIREMKVIIPGSENRPKTQKAIPNVEDELPWDPTKFIGSSSADGLSKIQKTQGSRSMGGPLQNFEGVGNVDGVYPADPNGDLGLDYYMQTVNRAFSVFDRDGEMIYGPVDNKSIWDGFEGPWNDVHWGADPVFKYDHLADRWVVSAFSLNFDQDLFYEMIAVSVTSDPLGEYYTYAFQFDEMPDYPKLAIWPDGYYLVYKWWGQVTAETVVDRQSMLNGEEEVSMIVFEDGLGSYTHSPLSVNLEGFDYDSTTPNFVVLPVTDETTNPVSVWMYIYEFKPNWAEPDSSTFELVEQLSVDPVSGNIPSGVVQPENFRKIDALYMRYMFPATYRKFDDHEAIVASHTLWNDEGTHLVRWYELRREADSGWYVYQQSGYSPDSLERWMGCINMNVSGDIALGYSVSGEETFPGIRYTGRLADDSLNMMTFDEIDAFKGMRPVNNPQGSNRNRWGDYSSMSVDPVDDSTFWFTTMYPTASGGTGNWSTRIIAFNLHEEGPAIFVDAGPADTMTCLTPLYEAYGIAENYSSVFWTSNGDGSFIVTFGAENTYYYGSEDKQNEEVTLYLNATGYEPGVEVVDSVHIFINKDAAAQAGDDALICSDESYTLEGQTEFSYMYYWSTSGDGMFSDSSALDAIYTPGAMDVDSGMVNIMLNAMNVAPCEGGAIDTLILSIDDCTFTNEIAENKLRITANPNPVKNLLNIKVEGISGKDLTVELLSLNGRALFTDKYAFNGEIYKHQLDLTHIPEGIYLIRVQDNSFQKTIKVIKN